MKKYVIIFITFITAIFIVSVLINAYKNNSYEKKKTSKVNHQEQKTNLGPSKEELALQKQEAASYNLLYECRKSCKQDFSLYNLFLYNLGNDRNRCLIKCEQDAMMRIQEIRKRLEMQK
jgi:hypothetical protein